MSLTEQAHFSNHEKECEFEDESGRNTIHLVGAASLSLYREVVKEQAEAPVVVAQDWVLAPDSDY